MFTTVTARAGLGAAALALALAGLTLPASTLAAHGHSGSEAHRAKAKGKKKKGSKGVTVKVKCASVKVTCKGRPGPAGPQGPAGPAGAPGAPGVNGSNVVLRSEQVSPVEAKRTEALIDQCEAQKTAALACGVPVAMAPASWTEAANEDDQLVGDVTITIPSEASCKRENSKKEPEPDEAFVFVSTDDQVEGLAALRGASAQTTVTTPIAFDLAIFALANVEGTRFGTGFFLGNGSSQLHNLSVGAWDECPETGAHATVSNATVDVLGTT